MKYGAAHVKGLYTVPNGSGQQFRDGCTSIFNRGLYTLKVYCASSYLTDYPLETAWSSAPANLTQLAQTTEFTTELAKAWDTVIFTVFTFANGTTNWWRADPNSTKLAAEYTEIYNLAVHLLTTYNDTGKTFIFQNWEGDWAFMDSFAPDTFVDRRMVDYYAAFLATRQRAVQDARAATSHKNVTVLNAFEVNRVLDARLYPHRRRILRDLASRLTPDLVSYSAYDSTIVDQGGWNADEAAWIAATTPAFRLALRSIKTAWPGVPVYVGEFGFPENEAANDFAPPRNVDVMIETVNTVALAESLAYLIYWEVFDNEASVPYTYRGYWLVKPNGDVSVAGTKMAELAGSN